MSPAEEEVRQAAGSKYLEIAARAGFAVNGLLHFAYGLICWQILFGVSGQTGQGGPITALAGTAAGAILLWIGSGSCVALALWQLSKAVFEKRQADLLRQLSHRGTCAGGAAVYAAIAVTLGWFVLAENDQTGELTHDITVALMNSVAGSVTLVAIGAGILGVAGYCLHKGLGQKFLDDLRTTGPHHIGPVTRSLGVAGYTARGVALGAVGVLIIVATVRSNPETSTGLDVALSALAEQPFGPYIVAGVGIGLFAYGIYSFARTRFAKM